MKRPGSHQRQDYDKSKRYPDQALRPDKQLPTEERIADLTLMIDINTTAAESQEE